MNNENRTFPFTTVVVTNPDEASACSAQKLLESTLKRYLNDKRRYGEDETAINVKVISTCDPFGARCGSFGGTLAALDLLRDNSSGSNGDNDVRRSSEGGESCVETVLCLHAGGDSSRCPLSMILGKAWTNLPSSQYRNPIIWLISQMEDLFYRTQIPEGSLLVLATDCVLSFGDFSSCEDSNQKKNSMPDSESEVVDPYTVLGVAVPSPLNTAKNHGVFIMPEHTLPIPRKDDKEGSNFGWSLAQMETPAAVWQKPELDKLLTNPTTTTISSTMIESGMLPPTCFNVPNRSGKQAWIDTGIVIFYPKAYNTLMNLSNGLLALCTRRGLEAAYHSSSNTGVDSVAQSSLQSFAKSNALKIDLYTDILHNLPLSDKKKATAPVHTDGKDDIQAALRKVLSVMSLKVLADPGGAFSHVGTTQELIEFITTRSYGDDDDFVARTIPAVMDQYVTKVLAKKLQFHHRFGTWQAPSGDDNNPAEYSSHQNNTILFSTFPSERTKSRVGAFSFVEYSDLQSYESVSIGDHCMVSGLRSWERYVNSQSPSANDGFDKALQIPDALSIQLLPLVSREENITIDRCDPLQDEWVMMVLGITDPTKAPLRTGEVYGIPFSDFVRHTGISLDQIGFQDDLKQNDCLWTAKLHPIVHKTYTCVDGSSSSFSSLFAWVEKLRSGDPTLRNDQSLANWLSTERVSLKQIHGIADASQEWAHRIQLEEDISILKRQGHIDNLVVLLRGQCQNVPCDLQWLINIEDFKEAFDTLCSLIGTLEQLALEEFANRNFHVSGRALMLASASISQFSDERASNDAIACEGSINNASVSLEALINKFKLSHFPSGKGAGDHMLIMRDILELRGCHTSPATRNSMSLCSTILEQLALCMIEFTIVAGFRRFLEPIDNAKISMKRTRATVYDKFVLSVAPVRVDLAGGWSDTPPITYEHECGGSVTGMAVLLDDHFPLSCRCRVITGGTGMLLKTELRDISTGSLLSSKQEDVTVISQLSDFRNPSASCALVKASLIVLGMLSEEQIVQSVDIQDLINQFCSSLDNVRIEIITTSLLGMGTGMGTSSILGACILQNLAECVGIGRLGDEFLINAILMLEQLLSSGGGWQDQAHGIVPGVNTVVSAPKIPLEIKISPVVLSNENTLSFEERLLFVFTGKTRLAKNILQQVLRRWAKRTNEIVSTVGNLVNCSLAVRNALENGSWDGVGEYMYQSYKLKCVMAGENSGAEPESVKVFISELMNRSQINGAMLCGAGGGGFLLLVMSQYVVRNDIESIFQKSILPLSDDFQYFSFHNCQIARRGLTSSIIEKELTDANTYHLSWQSSKRPD
ncbi:unnamed protein product [Pseudo-nitzschia multistriata]|uniref:GDP-fucose pyrophosphorylase domain-containing protein n=1 Tax=Pseudo-nitzschia multistriata TaxID=183589 RepID=A0A448ZII7_9STRA|nr:unnamed protein product [Pseudo-nitzschia multistriata]